MANPHTGQKWAARRRQAQAIADAGGSWFELASRWGTGISYAHRTCHDRWPDIAMKISTRSRGFLGRAVILHRLQTVREERGDVRAASSRLGLSPPTLRATIDRHAPDGLSAAIERLSQEVAA